MNRGSEWGRWDLHVHTKNTAKNDQFGNITFDEFCIDLFKKALDKDIKVIGITDYFNIDNYKKVKQFQKGIDNSQYFSNIEKSKIKNIFLLPNIELRVTPSTDKGGLINLHILLDPDFCDIYELQFARLLTFTYSETDTYSLDRGDLIRLGKDVNSNPSLNEEQALNIGVRNFILNPSDLIKAFKKMPAFRGNCIIAVANSNKDGNSSYQGHEKLLQKTENATLNKLRESIYKLSDVIFSSRPGDVDFFLGKNTDDLEEFLEKIGSLKPCIHGSDAHCLEKLFEPDGRRYCWVKSEPSFEGLKQILHEPETRVFIGENRPEPKVDYEVIDKIKINHENIGNTVLYLNPNLNTIVGGRSSGKSTLVQCIANKINPESLQNGKPETHVQDISDYIQVIWRDGVEDNSRSIDYFYQGHMFNKTHKEGIESIVEEILFELNTKVYEASDKKISELKQENASQISQFFSKKKAINQKREQANNIGSKKDILNELDKLSQSISKSSVGSYTEDELEEHNNKQITLKAIEDELTTIDGTLEHLDKLSSKDLLQFYNPFLEDPNYQLIKDKIENGFANIKAYVDTQIEELKQKVKIDLNKVKTTCEKEISSIKSDERFIQIEHYLKVTESLKPIIEQKTGESKKLERVTQLENEIELINQEAKVIWSNIQANWKKMNNEPSLLIKAIEVLNDDNLKISPISKFKDEQFNAFIVKYINQQPEKAQNFAASEFSNLEDLLLGFSEIKAALDSGVIKFKSGFTEENFYSEFLTTPWFKLSYDVIYEGDSYSEMSQGKKAFIVLKLSLECSDKKCPIIIDQPEDDLDNRAIYTELVKYIKNKKSQRQIILVTHNANVVVNADSEQIIVANQHGARTPNKNGKKFEYKCGSIESNIKSTSPTASILDSKTIKEHICEILEGGDTAFKLREKKYNI